MEATMHEAKTNLSKLVARARAGDTPAATPPSRLRPRGKATISGSVDSGQSMLRPVNTARSLVFQRTRVHTGVKLPDKPVAVI